MFILIIIVGKSSRAEVYIFIYHLKKKKKKGCIVLFNIESKITSFQRIQVAALIITLHLVMSESSVVLP